MNLPRIHKEYPAGQLERLRGKPGLRYGFRLVHLEKGLKY